MGKILIYGEGEEDKIFLLDFIHFRFGDDEKYFEVEATHSKTKIPKVAPKLQENTDAGGVNIIIFDADNDFEKAKNDILNEKEKNNLELDYFLFPDNENIGQFETLLMQICPIENLAFFDCWKSFYDCTDKLVNKKSSLYSKTESQCYCEIYLDKSIVRKIEKKKISYINSDAWNLKHTALEPLYLFLKEHLETIK